MPAGVGLAVNQNGVAQAFGLFPTHNIRPLKSDDQLFEERILPNQLAAQFRQQISKTLGFGTAVGLLNGRFGFLGGFLLISDAKILLYFLLDGVKIQFTAHLFQVG